MPQLTILPHPELCPDGLAVPVRTGHSLCESLLRAGVAIEHACDMVTACATCHVLVREGLPTLAAPDEEEEDQLDKAWGLEPCSRLACAVRMGGGDLTIELPRHTRNHARERA